MKIILMAILSVSILLGSKLGWSSDYEKTIQLAKKQNKEVYILITSSNCGWCRKFENTTLQDKKTIDELKSRYILLHLDKDFDDFPKKFTVTRFPAHFFITPKEEIIQTFAGYWNSGDFISFLKDIDKIERF